MGRQQADVRREEILRAAATVVTRKGFARTRVQDVATELGISAGLVFYHFDSKERMLSEAFAAANERDLEALDAVVTGPGSCVERLRAVLSIYQPTGEADGWSRDIDAWAEGRYTQEIQEACRLTDVRWRAGLQAIVSQGVATGEFACDDPYEAALRIAVLLDGLAVASQVRGTITRARASQWLERAAARELGLLELPLPPAGVASLPPVQR
jgi:AcrR family transcriptional regulator